MKFLSIPPARNLTSGRFFGQGMDDHGELTPKFHHSPIREFRDWLFDTYLHPPYHGHDICKKQEVGTEDASDSRGSVIHLEERGHRWTRDDLKQFAPRRSIG
jgi:hypothetical protein